MIKKSIFSLLLILGLVTGVGVANAAPTWTYQTSLLPQTDNTFDLGSSTPAKIWKSLFVKTICLSGDCKSTWPTGGTGGTGTVGTSSSETATQVPFWTTTNGTPALLSGGNSGFTFNTGSTRLTVTNASTTAFSSSYASSTTLVGGSLQINNLTGLLKGNGTSVVTVAANGTDYTLITAKTCSAGDFVSSVTAAGVFTCTTPAGTSYTGTAPIRITGSVIDFTGLATTSQPSSSQVLTSNGAAGVYGSATSTLTASGPLTGSFTHIGTTGSLGCTTASAGVAGCLNSTDWSTFNNKQNTISVTWPITLSGATVGFNGLSTTTNLTQGQLPYVTGVNTFGQVATTSVTCSGTVSCTSFTVIGASPITLAGSASGGTGLATSSPVSAGNVLVYSSTGAGSAFGVATSSLTISGPFVVPANTNIIGSGGSVTYTGLGTTSQPSSSQLLTSNGAAGVYGTATSTLTASGPLTGSFTQVGTGGALGCTTAASGVAGCLSNTSFDTFNNKLGSYDAFSHPAAGQSATTSLLQFFGSASTTQFTSTSTTYLASVTGNVGIGATSSPGSLLSINGIANFTTASTTFYGTGGLNIAAGCFAIAGTCLTAGSIGGGSTEAVNWATAAVLAGTPTYSNGASGVGATLTEVGTGALSVDGNSPAAGDRVLVKNQASPFQNGIYNVTATGSGIASYVLTRSSDYNTATEITPGITTYVLTGTTNTDTTWAVSYTPPLVIGTNNLNYTEAAGTNGTVTSITLGGGLDGLSPITTTGTITAQIGTSSVPSLGGLAYWTGIGTPSTLGTVATSSETCSSPISCAAHTVLTGGGAITLGTVGYANGGTGTTTAPQGQLLYGGATAYQSVATSTFTPNADFTTTGTIGAFVGGSASTLAFNLTTAHSWSALQTFANATTTLLSANYASSTQAFFGTLNLPGITGTQCLHSVSGVVSGTGSDCGTGGGIGDPFTHPVAGSSATSTSIFSIGTSTFPTTPGTLTLANSTITKPLLSLSSGAGFSAWSAFNEGGNFYLATTSDTTGATNTPMTSLSLVGSSFGTRLGLNIGAPRATLDLYEQNGTGCSPSILMGGNASGDTDFYLCRNSDNSGTDNDKFQIGRDTPGGSVALTIDNIGRVGIGSTTPWAQFAIASSTWNSSLNPLFSIATSSDSFGSLFSIFATSTAQVGANGLLSDLGTRIAIGITTQFGFPGILDQLFVNGTISTGDWEQIKCVATSGIAAFAADAASACGDFQYQVDTLSQGGVVPSGTTGLFNFEICPTNTIPCGTAVAQAAGNGGGLFMGEGRAGSNHWMTFGTSTPKMNAVVRIVSPQDATSTIVVVGITNIDNTGTAFDVAPTSGCYFTASSTQADWQAICQTSSSLITQVDTGFASSTSITATGAYQRFRIEADNNGARFYMGSSTAGMRQVANIKTNYPNAVVLEPGVYTARSTTAGLGSGLDINRITVDYFQPVLNYSL